MLEWKDTYDTAEELRDTRETYSTIESERKSGKERLLATFHTAFCRSIRRRRRWK